MAARAACALCFCVGASTGCDRPATAPEGTTKTEPSHAAAARSNDAPDLWSIVNASARKNDDPASLRAFRERLDRLPADHALRVHQEFRQNLARSYTWELWGAAYVINGGCSDDCFEYFRAWLVMQGRSVFDGALSNPDSLAEHASVGRPAELEEALSVTRDAYRAKTGKEPSGDVAYPKLPDGWDFDDSSEMKRRYPKLCRKFGC